MASHPSQPTSIPLSKVIKVDVDTQGWGGGVGRGEKKVFSGQHLTEWLLGPWWKPSSDCLQQAIISLL